MVYAQVVAPPSLEVGLSQVLGTKGTIDIEILADIIAEKQGELKKEFVKRSVLNHLENQSYVVWEYAYNSMDILGISTNRFCHGILVKAPSDT